MVAAAIASLAGAVVGGAVGVAAGGGVMSAVGLAGAAGLVGAGGAEGVVASSLLHPTASAAAIMSDASLKSRIVCSFE